MHACSEVQHSCQIDAKLKCGAVSDPGPAASNDLTAPNHLLSWLSTWLLSCKHVACNLSSHRSSSALVVPSRPVRTSLTVVGFEFSGTQLELGRCACIICFEVQGELETHYSTHRPTICSGRQSRFVSGPFWEHV